VIVCGLFTRRRHSLGFAGCGKSNYFVIPSEARNLSEGRADEKKERFLASLGMTKIAGELFSAAYLARRRLAALGNKEQPGV
jgi:hypothetical protein